MKQKQAKLNKMTTKTATPTTVIIMEYVRCSIASVKCAIANRIKMHIFLCTIIQWVCHHPFSQCPLHLDVAGSLHFKLLLFLPRFVLFFSSSFFFFVRSACCHFLLLLMYFFSLLLFCWHFSLVFFSLSLC